MKRIVFNDILAIIKLDDNHVVVVTKEKVEVDIQWPLGKVFEVIVTDVEEVVVPPPPPQETPPERRARLIREALSTVGEGVTAYNKLVKETPATLPTLPPTQPEPDVKSFAWLKKEKEQPFRVNEDATDPDGGSLTLQQARELHTLWKSGNGHVRRQVFKHLSGMSLRDLTKIRPALSRELALELAVASNARTRDPKETGNFIPAPWAAFIDLEARAEMHSLTEQFHIDNPPPKEKGGLEQVPEEGYREIMPTGGSISELEAKWQSMLKGATE